MLFTRNTIPFLLETAVLGRGFSASRPDTATTPAQVFDLGMLCVKKNLATRVVGIFSCYLNRFAPAAVSASVSASKYWSVVETRAYPMIVPYDDKNLPKPQTFFHRFWSGKSLMVRAEIERDWNARLGYFAAHRTDFILKSA